MWSKSKMVGNLAASCHSLCFPYNSHQPLTRQSYTSTTARSSLHFKTIESLTCLRQHQQQRLTTPALTLGSPSAHTPSSRFCTAYLRTRRSSRPTGIPSKPPTSPLRAAPCRKSEEEAGERAVAQRIHESFVRMQKVIGSKRKEEAKV